MEQRIISQSLENTEKLEKTLYLEHYFLTVIKKISEFLSQAKDQEYVAAREMLEKIRQIFFDITDMHGIDPNLDFLDILAKNTQQLEKYFIEMKPIIQIEENAEQANITIIRITPADLYQYISAYLKTLTEQYIKLAIHNLYSGLMNQVLPSMPANKTQPELTVLIAQIDEFFQQVLQKNINYKLIFFNAVPTDLAVQSRKKLLITIEKYSNFSTLFSGADFMAGKVSVNPPFPLSSQEIRALQQTAQNFQTLCGEAMMARNSLAQLLNELKDIAEKLRAQDLKGQVLDPKGTYIILLIKLIFNAKESNFLSEVDHVALNNISKTLLQCLGWLRIGYHPIQKALFPKMPNFHDNLLPSFLAIFSILNMHSAPNDVKNLLCEIYSLYEKNPDDFRDFPETLAQDPYVLKNACYNELNKGGKIQIVSSSKLLGFYTLIKGRFYQMKICDAYNNAARLVEYDSKKSLENLIQNINQLGESINVPSQKETIFNLSKRFAYLQEKSQQISLGSKSDNKLDFERCIVAIEEVLQDPNIFRLHPNAIARIISGFEEATNLLDRMLDWPENVPYQFERMRLPIVKKITASNVKTNEVEKRITNFSIVFFSAKAELGIQKIAEKYELIYKDVVEKNADCCFLRVLLFYLKNNMSGYESTSFDDFFPLACNLVIQNLSQNPEPYKRYLNNENINAYLERMLTSNTWDDAISLSIFAIYLEINIVVFYNDGREIVFKSPTADSRTIFCVGYESPTHCQLFLPKPHNIEFSPAIQRLVQNAASLEGFLENKSPQIVKINYN